ncbi:MAG: helix-turn-helix transcriptional regulator [Planctomycetota bacterium]
MEKKKITKRIRGPGPTPEKARELAEIRQQAKEEFPPLDPPRLQPATTGIAADLRRAREARGLTWYAVAEQAGLDADTIRDIEYGREAKLSNIEAVANALGLRLELIEQAG